MDTRNQVKLGTIIQGFNNAPLNIKGLLFPNTITNSTEKERYKKVFNELFYSNQGKPYFDDKVRYFKNKAGFYVLELPDTYIKGSKSGGKDDLGYKIGKAESNPTSSEASRLNISSGGLYGRLLAHYIQLGKNIRVLHLRVFNSEDLNYHGNKKRANLYETAVKKQLKTAEHLRGGARSEYFESLSDIKKAIMHVDTHKIDIVDPPVQKEYQIKTRSTGS